MYNSCHPLRNRMMVANLGIDSPQMQIDIYPYRFIKFVSLGMQDFANF